MIPGSCMCNEKRRGSEGDMIGEGLRIPEATGFLHCDSLSGDELNAVLSEAFQRRKRAQAPRSKQQGLQLSLHDCKVWAVATNHALHRSVCRALMHRPPCLPSIAALRVLLRIQQRNGRGWEGYLPRFCCDLCRRQTMKTQVATAREETADR